MQHSSHRDFRNPSSGRGATGDRYGAHGDAAFNNHAVGDDGQLDASPSERTSSETFVDGTVACLTDTARVCASPSIDEPGASLDHAETALRARVEESKPTSIVHGTTPAAAIRQTRRARNYRKIRSAYSVMGGILIGSSIALAALALDTEFDHGGLLLSVAFILALLGFGLHTGISK